MSILAIAPDRRPHAMIGGEVLPAAAAALHRLAQLAEMDAAAAPGDQLDHGHRVVPSRVAATAFELHPIPWRAIARSESRRR